MQQHIYDVAGIGIGPYNLGLAALMDQKGEVDGIFFDKTPEFAWHPGMLIETMDLQVPFLADLVTFADPKSPYTFMNYLYEHDRMFPFFFHRHFEVPRQEYNHYMKWVAGQIDNLHFGHTVIDVLDRKNESIPHYEVVVEDHTTGKRKSFFSRHVVLGTGSEPIILDGMDHLPNEDVLHTSRYLFAKDELLKAGHVTVVGSGQSALEVFLDLLEEQDRRGDMKVSLLTRSGGLFQLDKAKFAQEMFTPAFVDYFHELSLDSRKEALSTLDPLRKGIDPETLTRLYTKLYHRTAGQEDSRVFIQPMTEIRGIEADERGYRLQCRQWQEEIDYEYETEKVVLATGYKPHVPKWFYDRFESEVEWEDEGMYKVTRDYQLVFGDDRQHHIFTLTDLVHSHGAGATNLGLSVHRNVHILNTIAGREIYRNQKDSAFQQFTVKDLQKHPNGN
ncbi:SidA/IucD/PvdA family monooxygenase [Halobacillus sp. ACCC02827]|uniref:lysine N(6)-hydroxylase/L-ornithine N(5)-oxygenase family protein n=1 Tax=Bacillaceae TaxID=186817 RepID=UPI0002A4FB50|nr:MULTISPECIES: SidA/IucD/PvdA family monooxygenase [Bacillaceae]ELK46751.1 lysine/ornithine monooxygenase [Halobacillus sp. BAB-2008]QHT45076.1 lysine N(6)-hydroxylase/L-ornithine N(5)-oxygenase family protein [Bacillus sp. SB49]WJE15851.1 SidA/IucD/PvdA family monooxygenase [Halobacillus sp. ACCC02827]